ncbi:hypothetical protein [Gulosibacter faecalis]|jgi:hypothetical protein|uniref:DUF4190 domain-containing protein n=1 Tax=Gulosibacter faecalis TaxID=272240 RepID=A0ABW5UV56_9MICO|nr:hypothetical protein [Gulosibacter faecalis]
MTTPQQPPYQQPYGQQPYAQPFGAPQPAGGEFNVMGLIAVICAVIAFGLSWIPLIGWLGIVPAMVAIGLGIAGCIVERYRGRRGLAIAGIIAGGVAFFTAIVLPIFTSAWFIFGQISQMNDIG